MYLSLTKQQIAASAEIRLWLKQFHSDKERQIATEMLLRLKFVSRDMFSDWVIREIAQLPVTKYALYSVRKLDRAEPHGQRGLWQHDLGTPAALQIGEIIARPGSAQGSEDLVASLIANLSRQHIGRVFDHPSISKLRNEKVRDIVLIDDSIGSGKRTGEFIHAMQQHPTYRSWWSYNKLRIHIISYIRRYSAERTILEYCAGARGRNRIHPVSQKVTFRSRYTINEDHGSVWHWGHEFEEIKRLCMRKKEIPEKFRLGYRDVFSSMIFFHSVPNTIPGMLFCEAPGWNPIFTGRALPLWASAQIEIVKRASFDVTDEDLVRLLLFVSRGVRSFSGIASRMSLSIEQSKSFANTAIRSGLMSNAFRVSGYGYDFLRKHELTEGRKSWNKDMYIPSSWCSTRLTSQLFHDNRDATS